MKLGYTYAALAAAMSLTWGPANAQSSTRTDDADGFSQSLSYRDYLKGADLRASELVGAHVRNAQGDNLGEIEELVIPSRDRDDMLVIVSVGGLLDIRDKLVALPYEDLRVARDGDTFYYDRTEEQLKTAPAYTYEAEAEVEARAEARRDAARAPGAATRAAAVVDRPRTAAPTAAPAGKSENVMLDVFDHRASDLIGATVLDDRGEGIGEVDDIVVSMDDDKLHAVIAIGGFVGLGAKRISLPFDDLQITSDDDDPQVRIPMTGEQLEQLVDSRSEFRYERQVAQAPADTPRG